MDWRAHAGLSKRWQSLSRGYAEAVADRLRRGRADASPAASDDRRQLMNDVLPIVREANKTGAIDVLRHHFAPSHVAYVDIAADRGEHVGPVFLLEDGRLACVVGGPWQRPRAVVATTSSTEPLLGVFAMGRSPNRRIYALGRADGVHLTAGWGGPSTGVLPWPTTYAPAHPEMPVPMSHGRSVVHALLPFDDGERALVTSPSGVFLLTADEAQLVHPSPADLKSYVQENGDDAFPLDLADVHAAVSPDHSFIVVGDRASLHRVLDAEGQPWVTLEPVAGHPHHAVFSSDAHTLVLSCRRNGDGQSVFIPVAHLRAAHHWQPEAFLDLVDLRKAVSTAVSFRDEYLIGDTDGFVRSWRGGRFEDPFYVGGRVVDIDVSVDGGRLAVCTDAGVLHLFDRTTSDPLTAGTAPYREMRRWLFWRGEGRPLLW